MPEWKMRGGSDIHPDYITDGLGSLYITEDKHSANIGSAFHYTYSNGKDYLSDPLLR